MSIDAKRGADLTRTPFAAFEAAISSPASYADSQPLGRELRAAGIEACRYRSARDPGGGKNFALFEPAFAVKKPRRTERWIATASRSLVEFKPGLAVRGERASFARSAADRRVTWRPARISNFITSITSR